MPSWSFGRKILATFLALAILTLGIALASILSLRAVLDDEHRLVDTRGESAELSHRLTRHQDRRVSELRAYLLSRDGAHLKNAAEARSGFKETLGNLLARADSAEERELIQSVRVAEEDYSKLVQKALADPGRTAWVLGTLARPRRIEVDSGLAQLRALQTRRMHEAEAGFAGYTRRSISLLVGTTAAIALLLLGLGWLLMRVVREEQRTLSRANQARDTLEVAERRAAFLAQSGKIVTENADPRRALTEVAALSVEWLANVCLIELVDGGNALRPAALSVSGTSREPLLRSLHQSLPQGLGSLFATDHLLEADQPVLKSDVDDPRLSSLGVRSFIAVPLRARGRALGSLLIFRTDESEPYGELDLQFVQELSHQTALAIDNARLLAQAEEGLRMREELLSTVAHDLKNPLTSIQMNSEMLLKQPEPIVPATDVQRSARVIGDASKDMERLIHDLLDLTKLESGRIALDRRAHDADELIGACLKALAPLAQARSIELVKEARPGETIAHCDRGRVIQVLSNLIGNAIKFTGPGGRIRVEAQATGEGIRFSVVDNGPGIPAEQLPHVFDRYWQARRTRVGSAGLGLSIARGIVEAHGGRIWVESALRIGSRFFFTLPEARKQSAPRAA